MAAFRHRQRTYVLKPAEAKRKWHLVDARGQAPGRLAVRVAGLLRGKDNPRFTPHTDSGDFVVVVNAGGVVFSGDKLDQKIYYRHSGYVGGLKRRTAREQMERDPRKVVLKAVRGMLPKNSESPPMGVGKGGASSMPPQHRNSVEMSASREWKSRTHAA